ncbi:hypothetical protein OPQ81_000162 [Rhizoctonia solani]|nr:hypothetical protein OPQ81_000162 [Rhizoctonia solani]
MAVTDNAGSVLLALESECIVGVSIYEGAINKERLLHFLRTQIVACLVEWNVEGNLGHVQSEKGGGEYELNSQEVGCQMRDHALHEQLLFGARGLL